MIKFENKIPVEDYLRLRKQVGWVDMPLKEAENAVNNCYYSVCIKDDDKVIGLCRVIYTGDYNAYLTDVVIDENYRHQGLGKQMINNVIDYMKTHIEEGFKVKIFLMAGKDRDSFYEQFGFEKRPNERYGSAFQMWLTEK